MDEGAGGGSVEGVDLSLSANHDAEAAFVRLAGDRLTVTYLLHLLRYDLVASNMSDVPGIPDEATDCEHTVL